MRAFIAIIIKDLRVRFSSPMELVFFILLPLVFTVALVGGSMAGSAARGSSAGRPLPLVLLARRGGIGREPRILLHDGNHARQSVQQVSDPTALVSTTEADLLLSLSPAADPANGLPFTLTFPLSPWRGSAAGTARRSAIGWQGARSVASITASMRQRLSASASCAAHGADAPLQDRRSRTRRKDAPQQRQSATPGRSSRGPRAAPRDRRRLHHGAQEGDHAPRPTTPAPRSVVSAASVAAEVLGALVQIGLLVGFGTVVFGLPWFSHPLELIGLSVAFCVAGASLGALLGAVCRTLARRRRWGWRWHGHGRLRWVLVPVRAVPRVAQEHHAPGPRGLGDEGFPGGPLPRGRRSGGLRMRHAPRVRGRVFFLPAGVPVGGMRPSRPDMAWYTAAMRPMNAPRRLRFGRKAGAATRSCTRRDTFRPRESRPRRRSSFAFGPRLLWTRAFWLLSRATPGGRLRDGARASNGEFVAPASPPPQSVSASWPWEPPHLRRRPFLRYLHDRGHAALDGNRRRLGGRRNRRARGLPDRSRGQRTGSPRC